LRLWAAGQEIRYVACPPIVHAVSPQRNKYAQNVLAVRNTILFDYLSIPHPYLVPRTCADTVNLFRYKLSLRTLFSRMHYVASGFLAAFQLRRLRDPVSREVYETWRGRQRGGAEYWPIDDIP